MIYNMMNTFVEMSHNGDPIPVTQVILKQKMTIILSGCFFMYVLVKINTQKYTNLQVILGLCSFFTIALGGLLIGVIYGLLTALVTKTTTEGK